MDNITNEDVKVFGRVVSVSTESVVADAEQIWDSSVSLTQNIINSKLINFKRTAETNINRISELVSKVAAINEQLSWFEASAPEYHA